MALPKTFSSGERLFASDLNDNFEYLAGGTPTDGQVLTFNATSGNWEAKDLVMKEKRIEAFTGSGTWTVPAGVTYAIAHMLGGGGGAGGSAANGSDGANSSVDFSSGMVVSEGGRGGLRSNAADINTSRSGKPNSGRGGGQWAAIPSTGGRASASYPNMDSQWIVAGAVVTPASSIDVVVGSGGAAGASGGAGGSGYVYIEYYEEV
jgi:hypothetical protein